MRALSTGKRRKKKSVPGVPRAAHEGDVVLFQEEVREEAAFLVHLHPAVDRDRCCDEERLCPLLHAKFEPERF